MTVEDIIEQSYRKPVRKIPPTHTLFFSPSTNNSVVDKEKKLCVEGGKFLTDTPVDSYLTVQSGLEFILSHFKEPLWPRKIATATTRGKQYEIPDKDTAQYYYKLALYEDCRIAGFRVSQTSPNLLFIDIDMCNFATVRGFKLALTKTLNNIKDRLNGHPTVIWSGRGYHIIQPIDCPVVLRRSKGVCRLDRQPK